MLKHDKGGANKEWNAFGVALNGWEMLDMSRGAFHSALTFRLEGDGCLLACPSGRAQASRGAFNRRSLLNIVCNWTREFGPVRFPSKACLGMTNSIGRAPGRCV